MVYWQYPAMEMTQVGNCTTGKRLKIQIREGCFHLQERTDKRKTKRLLCALLAAAAVMGAAMPCAAVRIEPMPEQAGTLYGTQGIEREIYQPLSQAVQQGKTELDLSLSQPIKSQTRFLELCRQALTQVRRDYPESFLDNHTDFTYYYNQNGYYRVVYQLGYLKLSDQQKQSMTDEVEKIVRQGKKQCSNIVQLLQYFQETLCRRVEYDMTAAKSDSDHYPTSFHAYGALMKGKSVCQGYAYAFKLLCDQAQIPCCIVTG